MNTRCTRLAFFLSLIVLATSTSSAQMSATSTSLSFGKEASVRASIPMNPVALGPGATIVSAAPGTTMLWDFPTTGNLYAAVAIGSISAGQLLTAQGLVEYGCQPSIIYEAPNHPYIIQSMLQGGTVNVGGTICGTTPPRKDFLSIEYGRKKISISVANGIIRLGEPTVVVFTTPADFIPLSMIRIDFGTEVLAFGGTGRVFTVPMTISPLAVAVTYPSDYQSESVGIQAIATTAAFIDDSPMGASGSGAQASGATVSNVASFKAVKPILGALSIALQANRRLVRRNGNVTYTYNVVNGTATELRDVRVWDNQFGNVAQQARLRAGGAMNTVNTPALTSTTKNYAIVSGIDPFGNTITAESNEVEVRVIDPAIRITMWADPGRAVRVGQNVTFIYQVENIGDAPLGPITIQDITDGFTFPAIGRLEPAQSATVQRSIQIRAGEKIRQARATAVVIDDPGGPTVDATDDETLDIRNPKLGLRLTADKTHVKINTDVLLTATVRNEGDSDLYNVSVTIDGQPSGSVPELKAGTEQGVSLPPQNLTATKTFVATATAVDNWQEGHSATAQVTVNVINPLLKVTVRANGASTKVRVKKGSSVKFEYTVENTGNCDLKNVKVLIDGNETDRIDFLPAQSSKSISPKSEKIDDDVVKTIRGMGYDPNGDLISAQDKIVVEAEGLLAGWGITVDKVKKLLQDIDVYKQKIESLYHEFKGGLKKHEQAKTNPCDDGRLSAILQEAQTYMMLYEDATKELQTHSQELIKIAASNPDIADILDLATKAWGGVSQRIQGMVDEMKTDWTNLNCGEPIKKDQIVNVTVSVKDENGKPLNGASVTCDKNSGTTGANGQCVFTLALSRDEEVSASASFTTSSGYTAHGNSSAKYSSGDNMLITISLETSPVQTVTITGKVVDKNNNPISGATVSVSGGVHVVTGADGSFTLSIPGKVGAKITITATAQTSTGKPKSASATATISGELTISIPTMMIQGVDGAQKPPKKITSLSISPSNPKIKVAESVSFEAIATFEDNSTDKVTKSVTWSDGSNTFTADKPGEFPISATHDGLSASATITVACADGEEWSKKLNKCVSLSEAIDDAKDGSKDDLCNIAAARKDYNTLSALVAEMNLLGDDFAMKYAAFNKAINDQKSDPCKNQLLAVAFVGAEKIFAQGEIKVKEIEEKATELFMKIGLCPDFEKSITRISVMIPEMLRMAGSTKGTMKRNLADMKNKLNAFGCDPNEVSQNGNTIAQNTGDPIVMGEGGDGGKEICGDGVDNNGNGLIDEGCATQSNANVLFYIFDSGDAKDDIFHLSVAGKNLGQSPKGGRSEFGLALSPGSYNATLLVIEDGDASGTCCGTYTITIVQGKNVLASQSGSERKGVSINIPFSVGASAVAAGTGSDAYFIDFNRVTQREGSQAK